MHKCSIHAGNVNLRVYLPDKVAANLNASASDGEIMSDESMGLTGALSERNLTGRLQGGGKTQRIHSTNRDVRIMRR